MLRNCRYCGRLLTTPPGTPCAQCLAEEDAAIERIEGYLEGGGTPTLADVTRETSVPVALLRRLIREGRISLAEGAAGGICVLCGKGLEGATGRLCARCATRVSGNTSGAAGEALRGNPSAATNGAVPGRRSGFYSRPNDRRPNP